MQDHTFWEVLITMLYITYKNSIRFSDVFYYLLYIIKYLVLLPCGNFYYTIIYLVIVFTRSISYVFSLLFGYSDQCAMLKVLLISRTYFFMPIINSYLSQYFCSFVFYQLNVENMYFSTSAENLLFPIN